MIYRLIVLTGPLTGQRITIEQSPMTLGRDADCTVPLPDPEAALKHAVIEHRAEGGQGRVYRYETGRRQLVAAPGGHRHGGEANGRAVP